MFYNRGEVLSDQFDHFKLILFWVPECSFCKKNLTKRDKVGIFRLRGGEGSPVPTSTNHNTTQKVNIFVKTKNVPNVLKCKINHIFFSHKHGFPNRGEGGSSTWEKFPHFPVFFGERRPSARKDLISAFDEKVSYDVTVRIRHSAKKISIA